MSRAEKSKVFSSARRAWLNTGPAPLAAFFASPEVWQCTYGSSWAACSSRCTKQMTDGRKACVAKPMDADRRACHLENEDRGAACLKACPVQSSPTNLPDCIGLEKAEGQ